MTPRSSINECGQWSTKRLLLCTITLKPWGCEEMKVAAAVSDTVWGSLLACACTLLPAHLCPVPWAGPAGPSITNRRAVMTCCASHKGRVRGKRQFRFHQSWGGVRRGLIKRQTLLIVYSSVSSQAQTSWYSGFSLRLVWSQSKYKIWIWKAVISSLPDQKHLKSNALLDSSFNMVLCSEKSFISVFCSCKYVINAAALFRIQQGVWISVIGS